MNIRIRGFLVPRAGNSPDQCEDAMWPGPGELSEVQDCRRFPAIVADGASEGYLAGLWARTLVETCGNRTELDFEGKIAAAVDGWRVATGDFVQRRLEEGRPLLWFEETALARGAAAALLDLEILRGEEDGDGTWSAVAVGDVCLFHVRANRLKAAFPIAETEAFGCTPFLIPSRTIPLGDSVSRASGNWKAGDRFLLATDALASWFLHEFHEGCCPWEILEGFQESGPDAFAAWVEVERTELRLKDDDVALLLLQVDGQG